MDFEDGIPVCFVNNSTNNGCISVFPQIWKKNVSQTITQSIDISIPKHYKGFAPDPHEIFLVDLNPQRMWNWHLKSY